MGVGRVVAVAAKVGVFLALVGVAVILFRRDSLRQISDRWALHKCGDFVKADIQMVTPWANPKVDRCEGSPTHAVCFVETTEKNGRKTAPIKDWDCTRRHLSDSMRNLMYAAGQPLRGNPTGPEGQKILDEALKAKQDLVGSIQYVTSRLHDRSELLADP